jgi:hypothetical protein
MKIKIFNTRCTSEYEALQELLADVSVHVIGIYTAAACVGTSRWGLNDFDVYHYVTVTYNVRGY